MVHGPLRIAKGGGRGETRVLPDTANGGRVCGAVRATMVVQFAMGAMVLDQLVVALVLLRASGCGGSLN